MELQSCKAGSAPWLYEFYRNTGYNRAVADDDYVFYAVADKQKIGVLRISKENGCSVLRGMQVLEPYQGQGVGSKLLEYLQCSYEPGTMYCIPKKHLVNFYQQIGFEVIESENAPEFLQDRFNGYVEKGLGVLIMKRESAS